MVIDKLQSNEGERVDKSVAKFLIPEMVRRI